jgi:hypothetical protein
VAVSIPLPVLLGLIVGGLGGTLAALHAIGWSAPATLDGPEAACARFALDYPDDTAQDVWVAPDGSTALLSLEDGSVGLVYALGDRFTVRLLGSRSVSSVRLDPEALVLAFDDVGFPRAVVPLPDSPARVAWAARLASCVSSARAS